MQVNAANPTPEIRALAPVKAETPPPERTKPEIKVAETEKPREDQAEHLEKLKTALAAHDISLQYSRDNETNRLVVKMVDEKTGEAVRQIPSEVSLKLAAEFIKLQGLFVDKQVKE